ncbi:MAG: hypothetical protein ACTS3F_10085 [Phycisphaerales bacterium]
MTPVDWLLVVQAVASVFMAGLIWTMQLVHYPLFAMVGDEGGAERFARYERAHMRRIGPIVGPMMLLEGVGVVGLLIVRPAALPAWMLWGGFGLLLVNWISTATLQGPMHQRLAKRFDAALVARLVRTNWIRTVAWSGRAALAIGMCIAAWKGLGG